MIFRIAFCLILCFGAFELHAQSVVESPAAPALFAPASPPEVRLSDFGLLESYIEGAEPEGLPVLVKLDGAAEKAGLQDNDILTAINGVPVRDFREARQALLTTWHGNPVVFRFQRGAESRSVEITLPEQPRMPITLVYAFDYAGCYGLEVENYQQSENGGVLIRRVDGGSGAAAGLKPGDIVVAAHGKAVTLWSEWYALLLSRPFQQPVHLAVLRSGEPLELQLNNTICPRQILPGNPLSDRSGALGIRQKIELLEGQTSRPGILIGSLTPGSRAIGAGLQAGDCIVEIDRRAINTTFEGVQALKSIEQNTQAVTVKVLRNTAPLSFVLPPVRQTADAAPGNRVSGAAAGPPVQEEQSLRPRVFRAFPNPNSGLFTLEFSALEAPVSVQVLGLNGSLLFSEELDQFTGNYSHQFDFRGTPPGPVLLRVEQNGQVFSKIVIIQ